MGAGRNNHAAMLDAMRMRKIFNAKGAKPSRGVRRRQSAGEPVAFVQDLMTSWVGLLRRPGGQPRRKGVSSRGRRASTGRARQRA